MFAGSLFWISERGSALSTVLVFVVVVSILLGLVLLIQALQHRYVYRDVHRLQARYGAEAGVYRALDDLDGTLRSVRTTYEMEGVDRCSVWVEPFGGYARVQAWAVVQGERVQLRALAGEQPPPSFEVAVLLGDARSSLTLTGNTHLTGPVLVGHRGIEKSDLRGTPFTGGVNGPVRRRKDVSVPAYDTSAYRQTLDRAEHLLQGGGPQEKGARSPGPSGPINRSTGQSAQPSEPEAESNEGAAVPLTTIGRRIRRVQGNLLLTEADSTFLREPVLALATGTITLRGVEVASGSVFLAGDHLVIEEGVRGRDAVFYGRDTLRVNGGQPSGQFLSRHFVAVGGHTRLSYPSVVYVPGPRGRIQIKEHARVDGLVLYPLPSSRQGNRQQVVLETDAQLRGALYNRARTELRGGVDGSVLTHQFGFYRSPTHYVNWLKDATVRRPQRPTSFVVPFGFEKAGRPTVLRWASPVRDSTRTRDQAEAHRQTVQ
jgi:hypothetical protein